MTTETPTKQPTMEANLPNTGTPLRNARREKFCWAYLGGASQTEACRLAGYSQHRADSLGNRLMGFADVQLRLRELRDIIASQNVMTIVERKERLSEIGKARLRDYHTKKGVLDPFNGPNQGAIAEVQQEYDPNGLEAYPVKIKLHDSVRAINELNKMERVYETGTNINIQQNTVNVQVISPKSRELTDKIVEGDRTKGGD